MPYDLTELWEKLPHAKSYHEFDDNSGRAVFAVRWYEPEFDSLPDFVRFCYMYSSVMQAVIEDLPRSQIEEYFVPDPASEAAAKDQKTAEEYAIEDNDAIHRLTSDLSFVTIPWLNDGDHSRTLRAGDDGMADIFGLGKEGYCHLFVSDIVSG